MTRDEAQTLLESYTTANHRVVELAIEDEQSGAVIAEAVRQLGAAYEKVIAALMASSVDINS